MTHAEIQSVHEARIQVTRVNPPVTTRAQILNHCGLLAEGGHYAALYTAYFRHESPDYSPTLDGKEKNLGFVAVRL